MDLLPQNIQQHWWVLPEHVRSMLGFPDIDFQNIWVCFNIQNTSDICFPKTAEKVVITYHTEYLKHNDLLEFFSRHQNTQFLFLSDWEHNSNSVPWPQNVTCVKWLTWHHQLDQIMDNHEANSEITRPDYKISSLSFQHEFHKAVVTAYLLKTFPANDMILSWWNVRSQGRLYYLDPGYFLPPEIADFLSDRSFQDIESIQLDSFVNQPMSNGAWSHPAYLRCVFNCTNESIYNDFCMIGNTEYKLPWPYLTEKTWKPLLAGCAFIPVGQYGTLKALSALGLHFIPCLMDIDRIEKEFDRMLAILKAIDYVNAGSIDDLFDLTKASTLHNLTWIRQGHLFQQCELSNDLAKLKIEDWINA